jgi:putative DNA methylase
MSCSGWSILGYHNPILLISFRLSQPDPIISIWEATHQLIRALRGGGEKESGFLLSRLPGKTEQIRQLAYRLYTLCERQGWAEEARAYNELISSWHRIVSASKDVGIKRAQLSLFRT